MIFVATSDLFFRTRIEEVARQKNVNIAFIENFDQIIDKDANMLIIDLNFEDFEPIECIKKLKKFQPHVYVIGYLSHVQTKLKEEALRAGCDEVMPRSQFSKNLADILTKNNL